MDYSKLSVAELRERAKEKGLRNITGLKKKELAELLENVDRMINKPVESKVAAPTEEAETPKPKKRGRPRKTDIESKSSEKKETKPSSGGKSSAKAETKSPVKAEGKPPVKAENKPPVKAENKPPVKAESKPPVKSDSKAPVRFDEKPAIRRSDKLPEVSHEKLPEKKSLMVYDGQEYNPAEDSGNYASGLLEVMADGYGFIRSDNYMPGDKDIYISPALIRRFKLKTGDYIKGPIKRKPQQSDKFSALLYMESVNGKFPSDIARRKSFEDLTPIFPNERIRLDYDNAPVSLRIVDLFSPIGKGQRGMIVSPPKAGKTTLLKQIAKRISQQYPDMHLLVLLIDERPEEVTDIKESIEGRNVEVIYSTFDELPEHHKRVSEMVIERAKRLVESGDDVVILIDSITRLSRAYNLTVPPSGRTLSGGLDPAALHMPKKFFGAARNMREGGSLTILATALIDTGSRMDDVVYEEFKGTGNMELVLDRNLSEMRVFPAIDITKSGTRKDDLLLTKEESEILDIIHSRFHSLKNEDVTSDIIKMFKQTKNNEEFISLAYKLFTKNLR